MFAIVVIVGSVDGCGGSGVLVVLVMFLETMLVFVIVICSYLAAYWDGHVNIVRVISTVSCSIVFSTVLLLAVVFVQYRCYFHCSMISPIIIVITCVMLGMIIVRTILILIITRC